MHCWRFSSNGSTIDFKRIYNGSALNQLEAGNSQICGLNVTNGLDCWQWRGFNPTQNPNFSTIAVGEGFVCGLSSETGKISCLGNAPQVPQEGNYSVIAAGFGHVCAITLGNDLQCWGNTVGVNNPEGKFMGMALGLNRSCALRTNETVVCWGHQNNFSLPMELEGSQFITIKAKRNVFCGVLKFNYTLSCWGDTSFNSSQMVFPEVMPGPCKNLCPCGSYDGSGSFCNNGETICQPCPSQTTSAPAPAPPPTPTPQPQKTSTGNDLNGKLIAFLVVGCVGCSCLLLVVGFFVFRYCKGKGCRVHDSGRLDDETGPAAPQNGNSNQPQISQSPAAAVLEKRLSQLTSIGNTGRLEEFSLEELLQATENFSEDQKIGTGSFGSVYHGTLEDGREVAIKRAEITSTSSYATIYYTRRQEDKDNAFVNELEYLSRLHHKNLVRLLGFCEDFNERVLVYEYMDNGTLHDHLHKLQNPPFMSWSVRLKIALDAARGIEYLHEYAVPTIIHRDIKSSNILLDSNWNAKVSDFGLSLLGPGEDESHISLRAAGTVGYMDPEYYRLQQLTTKSDVYSFGVVLLELLSGRKAIHMNENGMPRNVVDFVVPYIMQDEIHRVLDPRVPPPTPFEIEAVAYVGYLAADCVVTEGRDRPSMTEVVNSLDKALAACLLPPQPFSRSNTDSST
ncbi:hypothetical protein CCACVL1_04005 [Corchorus capsularis]|uniref:non-specific serine/threonine protein kinase n=1 Tax=Corchorus capsularis TaxID=210143 RepID=A0A1R3JVK1_COCAP|nr:hypothetical protein CCACVL1_04005 [Corchorus capsularis]